MESHQEKCIYLLETSNKFSNFFHILTNWKINKNDLKIVSCQKPEQIKKRN